MSRCCDSQSGSNGHNSRTSADEDSSSGSGSGSGEITLFGVRVKVDPMRKSVSLNNLSQYQQPNEQSSNADVAAAAVAVDTGYASADDAARRNQSNAGSRERKRGTPWTEDEHKLFLIGLQKVGKGDWRGISRNFVKTRTPTQVASHAQKYFLRHSNLNRRRRRTSLFDITTDTVAVIPMEEEQGHQDNNTSQSVLPPMLPSQEISPLGGFPMAPFQATPVQIENPMENLTLGSMIPVRPIPSLPMANPSADINLSQKPAVEPSPLSLKLSLSLSSDQYQSRPSAFQVMSSFNNDNNVITVA